MERKYPPIATEGFLYIGICAFLAWAAAMLGFTWASVLFAVLTLFNIYFFRDPERSIPGDPRSVVSPADGKVMLVDETVEKDFLDSRMKRVSISLALYNCHINRVPIKSKVAGSKYTPGSFHIANMPDWLYPESMKRASDENEKLSTLFETEGGDKVVVVQMTGFLARRIISYAGLDMEFKKGERYGMIKFGSRVDVYFPTDYEITVDVGDRITGGDTVIARSGERQV